MGHARGRTAGATTAGRLIGTGARGTGTWSGSWLEQQLIAVLAVILLASTLATPVIQSAVTDLEERLDDAFSSSEAVAPGAVPEGLTAEEWADIQSQIAALQASQELAPQVTVESVATPTLRLGRFADASFATAGATFTFDDQTVRLGTVSVGGPIAAAAPELDGERVVYDRGIVDEWFVETTHGVQQGWTIAEAPAGVTDELVIEVAAAADGLEPVTLSDDAIGFADADGDVVATYAGLLAWDADDIDLAASMAAVGDRIAITVDVAGATYPITVDPTFTQTQQFGTVGNTAFDFHGSAIDVDMNAVDGPVAVVATPESDQFGGDTGAVTVLRRDGAGTWAIEAQLRVNPALGPGADFNGNDFGADVAVLDTQIAVGSPGVASNGTDSGAVHIYEFDGTNWLFAETLYQCLTVNAPCGQTIGQGGGNDFRFGAALDFGVSGELWIGAPGTTSGQGVVFQYTDDPSGYLFRTFADRLLDPAAVNGGNFGAAIDADLNGNVIIGAPGGNSAEGAVYWAVETGGVIDIDELVPSGSTLSQAAIGQTVAVNEDVDGTHVFIARGANPSQQNSQVIWSAPGGNAPSANSEVIELTSTDPGNAAPGAGAVAFDGSTFLIGTPRSAGAGLPSVVSTRPWDAVSDSIGSSSNAYTSPNDGDGTGLVVAIAGTDAFIGVPLHDTADAFLDYVDAGIVRIRPLDDLDLSELGSTEQTSESVPASALEELGFAVAVEGDVMAVGAPSGSSRLNIHGVVYIYTRASAADPWALADIVDAPPVPSLSSQFGSSVDVRNGRVAVGAPAFGADGYAYVFEPSGGSWTLVDAAIPGPVGAFGSFGFSVSFGRDENHLFVGAPTATAGSGGTGVVYETINAGGWSAPAVVAEGPATAGSFGQAIDAAVNADNVLLVVGDPTDSTDVGRFSGYAIPIPDVGLASYAQVIDRPGPGPVFYGTDVAVVAKSDSSGSGVAMIASVDEVEMFEGGASGWAVDATTTYNPVDVVRAVDVNLSRLAILAGDEVEIYNLGAASGAFSTPDDEFIPSGFNQPGFRGDVAVDDGTTIAFGSPRTDVTGPDSGQVFITEIGLPVNAVIGEPSVDIDGNWAIYGVPADDVAYVLEYSAGSWQIADTLTGTAGTSFGAAVAIQDRVLTVGAPGADGNGVDSGTAIQYYRNSDTDIDFLGELSGAGQSAGDLFGFSVETNEIDILVGAPGTDAGGTDNGAVHVFKLSSGPTNSATFDETIFGGTSGMEAGFAIAAAGTGGERLLAVGAPGIASDGGVVGVYRSLNGGSYSFVEPAPISVSAGDRVGESVDIATLAFNRVAVLVGGPGAGEAYYALIDLNSTFQFVETLTEAAAGFGSSVSMSGDSLLVGSESDSYSYFARHDGVDRVEQSTGNALDPVITDVAIEGRLGLAVPNGTSGTDLTGDNLVGPIPTLGTADSPATKLFNPVAADYDGFGIVAADGDTIVVAAPRSARRTVADAGRVFVFKRSPGSIDFDQEIDSDDFQYGGDFGGNIAISGNVLVVSDNTGEVHFFTRLSAAAPFAIDGSANVGFAIDSLDTDGQTLAVGAGGSLHVFRDGPAQWGAVGPTVVPNPGAVGFGRAIAVEGDVIYAGQTPGPIAAPFTVADQGNVFVYRVTGAGTIGLELVLSGDRTGTTFSDNFGGSLDVDNGRLIVGASYDLNRAGQAYLFECVDDGNDVTCDPDGAFDGGGLQGAEFGVDVAVAGDLALIAARQSGAATFGIDSVLLRNVNGTWHRTTQLFDAPDVDAIDQYNNLALTADYAVLGAPLEDQFGADAGAATVIPIPDADEVVNTDSGGTSATGIGGNDFGDAVAIDGDTMVVGASSAQAGNEGLAYVFDRNVDGVWQYTQELDAGFGLGGEGGTSVAIEGDTIVIGAPFHNGASEGGVAVFDRSGGVWSQNGGILTSPTGGGWLGFNVDIEGDRIVAGAPLRNNGAAISSGGYSIFDRSGGSWSFTTDVNLAAPASNEAFGFDVVIDNGDVYALQARSELVSSVGAIHRFTGGTVPDVSYTPTMGAPFLALDVADGVAAVVNIDGSAILHEVGTSTETAIATSQDGTDATVGNTIAYDGTNLVVGFDVAGGGSLVESFTFDGASWVLDADLTPTLLGGRVADLGLSPTGDLAIGVPGKNNVRGLDAGSVFVENLGTPPVVDNPLLQFDLGLGAGQPNSVPVAPGGIAIADIDAALLEAAGEGTLAASPLGQTELQDSPLSALEFGETQIPAVILNNPDLYNLPLIDVELDQPGGWTAILEGTPFADRPLVDITLGEVIDASVNSAVAGEVASLPLSALDVNGTPLSALPLSALVLGNIPLSALPLSALGTDLCTVFADAFPPGTSCTAIIDAVEDLSVTEAALQGLPLSALPLSALPLSALPLSALQLEDSPLSALPLSALPLSALELDTVPLSELPLSALPLSALPLSALGLDSTPLSALPLSALEINGVPLSALEVEGAPLSALPLSALPLSALAFGNEQLSTLPVPDGFADWCEVLAETSADYNCSVDPNADDQTIVALGLRGVPLSALPLSALPLSALPLSALPLSALPLSALPLSALPLSALPLSALPLSALPPGAISVAGTSLSDIPLSALDIQGSPLSALPLSALPLSALPLSALPLSALPLSALPLSALPLSALQVDNAPLSALPLSALDVLSSPLSALPLSALPLSALPLSALDCSRIDCENDTIGDALLAGALDPNELTFGQIQDALEGIGIGELLPYFFTLTGQDFQAAIDASGLTLLDLLDLSELTLGDLPITDPLVADLLLGQLVTALGDVSLSDLGVALGLTDVEMQAVLNGFDLGDLETYGDLTLGEALANGDGGVGFGLDELGPFLGLLDLQQLLDEGFGANSPTYDGETLGGAPDLGALTLADLIGLLIPEYDTLTLGELLDALDASGNLLGFVLADLLAALVGLEDIAFGNVDFAEVEAGSLPVGTVPDVQFRAGFQVTDTVLSQSVVVDVELPATATYVPGTAIVNDGVTQTELEPTVVDNRLQWTVFGVDADEPHLITFDVRPEVTIGSTSLNARGRIVGTDTTIPASAAVTVAEGLEDNDYPATTLVVDDTVYLTYISTTTDRDVFEVTVGERDRLAIQLSSLSADLDLVLYGVPDDVAVGSALTGTSDEAPLSPITNPDATDADSEPLEDFPRLDQLFPGDGLQLIEVSNASGTADELIITDALAAGTYYVQVHGANGARNQMPATLQIQTLEADVRPDCSTLTDILGGSLPAATPGSLPADLTGNTLFLVNEQRLEQLYGPTGRADVLNSLDALVLYLESNPSFGLDPIVIPVEAYAGVQSAYAAWDDPVNADDACDPEVANAVVSEIIANAVDPIRDQLDHMIIVGGDDIIPMARLQDETTIANEYDYRTELVGDLNGGQGDNVSAFTASFWESRYLSDDPYGEAAARSLGDRFLYVPDVSLGRLVEAPAEIASALDHFVTFQGTLDMNTAAVLGYDFLVDSSTEIASDLAAAGLVVDDDLADGIDSADGQPWDRTDAEGRVVPAAGSAADLISFNAHFDHYRALPAAGDQVPGFLDNFETSAIENALPSTVLEGTVLFSAGCHGGLSVSDIQIGVTNLDWAQAASQADALWIGNTGFGYGDTETIAYTEQLMALFAEEVVNPLQLPGASAPTTIGQAFTVAKNRFISENAALSVYDEKASMEAVFYGLPIYRVGIPAEPAPPAPENSPTPDATGTPSIVVTVDGDPTAITTPSGVYYAETDADGNEEIISVPGRPVQPKTSEDISVVDPADTTRLDQIAHGGLILDMTSEYVSLPDPVIASVVVDESDKVPEPEVPNSIFPSKPLTITQSTTATGQRQTLSIATGQYRPGAGVQRLDDDIDVNVYYADRSETDFNAPRIGRVESTIESGLLTVTARVADDANGVDRVYVLLAQDPGIGTVDWDGFDLTQGANPEIWSGSIQLDAGTSGIEFIVQAKDGVGNVGYANDKAGNFSDDTQDTPEPPAPVDLAADFSTANLDPGGSGWYTGDVVVTVTTDTVAGYSVDGAPFVSINSGDSFTVTGDGIHTVEIETPAGERIAEFVRIDTTGFPEFTAGTPVPFGSYGNDQNNVYDFLCSDPSLVSCDASVGGVPVEQGDPLPTTPGTYVLTVVTVDALGNDATYTVPFDITAPLNNLPEITLLQGPTVPELISDGVTLDITFGDADGVFDDYTVDIDWGDYDDDDTPGSSTICSTSSGSPTPGNPSCEIVNEPTGGAADGLATASFVYPEPGVYAIEVTITDSAGNTDTSLFEFAVVYDPAAGRVSGAGWYWSGPEAYAEEEPWGGPAFFGYRARYRSDEETPRGRTKLHLLGEFFFKSTSYDYLIVNDTVAVAEGVGKIGRDDGYRFRVQGIDNGWLDFFQITIWDDETGEIVYDNGILYDEGDVVLLGGIRVRS